jgi:hypothetical protein
MIDCFGSEILDSNKACFTSGLVSSKTHVISWGVPGLTVCKDLGTHCRLHRFSNPLSFQWVDTNKLSCRNLTSVWCDTAEFRCAGQKPKVDRHSTDKTSLGRKRHPYHFAMGRGKRFAKIKSNNGGRLKGLTWRGLDERDFRRAEFQYYPWFQTLSSSGLNMHVV